MNLWLVTCVSSEQIAWSEFCLSFMSSDVVVTPIMMPDGKVMILCFMYLDPLKPIDSTGSMPSFIDQAKSKHFDVRVTKVM